MDERLKNYSQEEIEALAIKQLENKDFEENASLKIIKINKEYKKHNIQAVKKAIINGSTILFISYIVLNSDSNISNFGTEDLSNMFDSVIEMASYLPKSDVLIAVYTKMFEGINYIIEQIGLIGIILASRAIKFVLSTTEDTKKSLQMRKELLELKKLLEEKQNKNENIR